MSDKPAVLILGGTGFVGRHLVKYLIDNNLVSRIRVADKQLPVTSYLGAEFKPLFENPIVEFKQANLSNAATVKKIFTVENDAYKFKYVVNLAAETRYGQEESVYKQHVFDLSVNCAKEAAAHGVAKYIEVSTAQVYEAGKKASNEKDKIKPWTKLAKYKQQAEEEIKKMKEYVCLFFLSFFFQLELGDTSSCYHLRTC
jgi:nucleoside-diphosphate-sugar epimerase